MPPRIATCKKPLITAFTAICPLLFLPSVALASDTPLEEIIVSVEKVGKSLQDTQVSVAVLTGDELQRRDVVDLEEALLYIGNANINTTGDVSIRGISRDGPTGGIPTNRTVLAYHLDGVALSAQAQRFALSNWNIQQLEVLRGPVTTIQGRNSLAGGIFVTTKEPEYDFSAKTRLSYGEHETYQVAAAVTGPILEDSLAYMLSVDYNDSEGYVTNTSLNDDEYGDYGSTTIHSKLLYEPDALPQLRANLAFSYIESDKTAGQVEVIGPDFDDRISIAGAPTQSEADDISVYSLTLDYELSDTLSLKSITAYQDSKVTNLGPFSELETDQAQRVIYAEFSDDMFSQELLLTYSNEKFTALSGLYYADIQNEQMRGGTFNLGFFLPVLEGLDGVTQAPLKEDLTNYAAFVDLSYQLTPWLEIIGGGRVDHEKNTFSRSSEGLVVPELGATLIPAIDENHTTENNTEVLPKLGAVATITDDISLGFTFSEGYRPGGSGVNLAETTRSGEALFFTYDAEKTNNYELSFRSQWFDRALTLNSNLYYIDWADQQANIYGPLGAGFDDTVITNAGASKLHGLEIEMQAYLGALNIFSSIGYSKTEFTDFVANGEDFGGNEFAYSPNFTGSIGMSYDWSNGLYFSASANYTGSSYQDNANEISIDSYTIINANFAYTVNQYRVFLYAKNIFDETATTARSFQDDFEFRRLRPPRQVGVGVDLSF